MPPPSTYPPAQHTNVITVAVTAAAIPDVRPSSPPRLIGVIMIAQPPACMPWPHKHVSRSVATNTSCTLDVAAPVVHASTALGLMKREHHSQGQLYQELTMAKGWRRCDSKHCTLTICAPAPRPRDLSVYFSPPECKRTRALENERSVSTYRGVRYIKYLTARPSSQHLKVTAELGRRCSG